MSTVYAMPWTNCPTSRQRLHAGTALAYHHYDLCEAGRDLVAWLAKWPEKYPKLCDWVSAFRLVCFIYLYFLIHKIRRAEYLII